MIMAKIIDTIIGYIENNHQDLINNASDKKETLIELDYSDSNNYIQSNVFDTNFRNIFKAVKTQLSRKFNKRFEIKVKNYPINDLLREIDADDIGRFITTTAMVRNITQIQLTLTKAVFVCRGCGKIHEVNIIDEKIGAPGKCIDCGGKSYELIQESSEYENYKYLKLEEPIELRISGDTREFKGKIKGYLASPQYTIKAGDICELAGFVNVDFDEKKNTLSPFIDIWHIKPLNSNYEEIKLSKEDVEKIHELSEDNIFDKLVNSVAPEVYGYNEIKKGLVLQMFGGANENNDRHTIHVLLIGDPGIGKSKLIESIYEISPKAIKANGAGTTQAGLTASAIKDEILGTGWSMEAGAIVLADGGLLTIDEFDKLDHDAMKSLNEPMEQLSCSVAKAGLVQTMSARTSVLAGANPKYSRFNQFKTMEEQINIPLSTISRFDLIYALTDDINHDKDLDKAKKVLTNDFLNYSDDILDKELIKKYVNYAKNNYNPSLSSEAIEKMSQFYAETRALALDYDDMGKPITLRELGAIKRLAVAYAKLHLRDIVTVEDTEVAIDIYSKSLESLGLNFNTVGAIQNVYSEQELKMIEYAENEIREVLAEGTLTLDYQDNIKSDMESLFDVDKSVVNKMFNLANDNVKKTGG